MDGAHLFELDTVLAEYESHTLTHTPVINPTTSLETPESLLASQQAYDVYKKFDIALSSLVVESSMSESFHETIKTCFSHYDNFVWLSSQVYFMMILDAYNTSTAIDIEGAEDAFKKLSLQSFPGENVSSLATTAIKFIKVVDRVYALPARLGSQLLLKTSSTLSRNIFNRNVLDRYNHVDEMERRYYLNAPSLMKADTSYSDYGPIAICGFLQEEYSKLYKYVR